MLRAREFRAFRVIFTLVQICLGGTADPPVPSGDPGTERLPVFELEGVAFGHGCLNPRLCPEIFSVITHSC